MKSLISAVIAATILAAPAISFAQSTQAAAPLTRAEVVAQYEQLLAAGYNPATQEEYPQSMQHAEKHLAQEQMAANNSQAVNASYGSSSAGMVSAGAGAK
jgi:hypothetical protein